MSALDTFQASRARALGQPTSSPAGSALPKGFTQQRQSLMNAPLQRATQPSLQPAILANKPTTLQKVGSAVKQVTQTASLVSKLDKKRLTDAFKEGAKLVPGQVKQAGGIIATGWVEQTKAVQKFFQKIPEPVKALLPSGIKEASQVLGSKTTQKITEPFFGKVGEVGEKLRQEGFESTQKAKKEYEAKTTPANNSVQKYAEAIAFNLPQMLASTGLALGTQIVTKNPKLASAVGFSTSFGLGSSEVYETAREEGLTDEQALPLGILGGTVIGAIDYLPLGRLLRKTSAIEPIKRSLVKNIAKGIVQAGVQAGFEGVTEGLQEIVSNGIQATYSENKDLFKNVKESIIVGTLLGGFTGVTVETGISALENATGSKQLISTVEKNLEQAIQTDASSQTKEQKMLADALMSKEMTPDEAISMVAVNNLEDTQEGQNVMKAVLQAKKEEKNVTIAPTPDGQGLQVTLVDRKEQQGVQPVSQKLPPTETVQETASTQEQVEGMAREEGVQQQPVQETVAVDGGAVRGGLPVGNKEFNIANSDRISTEVAEGKRESDRMDNAKTIYKAGRSFSQTDPKSITPESEVVVYRASKGDITSGNFVTTNKQTAEGFLSEREGAKLSELKVKVKDLVGGMAQNDVFVYSPKTASSAELNQQLVQYYITEQPDKFFEAMDQIVAEFEIAEPGEKLWDSSGEFMGSVGSTFPQWLPEDLRRKPILERTLKELTDFSNFVFPPNSQPKKQELYTEIFAEIDERTGLNSSEIINQIQESYAKTKPKQKTQAKTEPQAETDRGTQGSSGKPKEKPVTKITKEDIEASAKRIVEKKAETRTEDIPHKEGFSRFQERLEEQLLDSNGEKYNWNDTKRTYDRMSLKEDAQKAATLLENNPEKAMRIAKGFEDPGRGDPVLLDVMNAVAIKAFDEGNTRLGTEMINKLSLTATKYGQNIVTLRGNFNNNSPQSFIKQVIDSRLDRLGKTKLTEVEKLIGKSKSAKTRATTRVELEAEKLQKRVNKELRLKQDKIKLAQQIIESLKC